MNVSWEARIGPPLSTSRRTYLSESHSPKSQARCLVQVLLPQLPHQQQLQHLRIRRQRFHLPSLHLRIPRRGNECPWCKLPKGWYNFFLPLWRWHHTPAFAFSFQTLWTTARPKQNQSPQAWGSWWLEELISNLEPFSTHAMTPFACLDLPAIDRTQTRKRSKQPSGAPKRYHKLLSLLIISYLRLLFAREERKLQHTCWTTQGVDLSLHM